MSTIDEIIRSVDTMLCYIKKKVTRAQWRFQEFPCGGNQNILSSEINNDNMPFYTKKIYFSPFKLFFLGGGGIGKDAHLKYDLYSIHCNYVV